jgi:hypothetical protein
VWDHDIGPQSDDFIGAAGFELADLQAISNRQSVISN